MREVTTVLEVVSNIPYSFNSDKIESYGEESNGLVIKRVVIKWRRNNITKSRSFLTACACSQVIDVIHKDIIVKKALRSL